MKKIKLLTILLFITNNIFSQDICILSDSINIHLFYQNNIKPNNGDRLELEKALDSNFTQPLNVNMDIDNSYFDLNLDKFYFVDLDQFYKFSPQIIFYRIKRIITYPNHNSQIIYSHVKKVNKLLLPKLHCSFKNNINNKWTKINTTILKGKIYIDIPIKTDSLKFELFNQVNDINITKITAIYLDGPSDPPISNINGSFIPNNINNNSIFYIYFLNKITKFSDHYLIFVKINNSTKINNDIKSHDLNFYIDNNKILFNGYYNIPYKIINNLGTTVLSDTIYTEINIDTLINGLYYLVIDNNIYKFIK